MKRLATGLLVLAAMVYIATLLLESRWPWLSWVRAAAEAAMVGGVADWFAVTALFRHPLGIPIPHTAIIPQNKDRIGDTLAVFLRDTRADDLGVEFQRGPRPVGEIHVPIKAAIRERRGRDGSAREREHHGDPE